MSKIIFAVIFVLLIRRFIRSLIYRKKLRDKEYVMNMLLHRRNISRVGHICYPLGIRLKSQLLLVFMFSVNECRVHFVCNNMLSYLCVPVWKPFPKMNLSCNNCTSNMWIDQLYLLAPSLSNWLSVACKIYHPIHSCKEPE